MRLNVVTEQRLERTSDGLCWDETTGHYDFWRRYLTVFDHIQIVARVKSVQIQSKKAIQVNGKCVSVCPLNYYLGPSQFAVNFPQNYAQILKVMGETSAVLFRLPSAIAIMAAPKLMKLRIPYGVELVGDPFDVFSKGVIQHPLRFFFKQFFVLSVETMCKYATGVAYVNATLLPQRYPPGHKTHVAHYSSIDLNDECYNQYPIFQKVGNPNRIIFIGSLSQLYKGLDLLIDAVSRCRDQGYPLEFIVVGDGRYRHQLEELAVTKGITDTTIFTGQLQAGEAVRKEIDRSDLFVLPARTEGLPRVIIEAMARSKPCISTTVGGIPELLPPEDLVPPNDVAALTRKIIEVISDPDRMHAMGVRNYRKAREYHKDILDRRRRDFYVHLRDRTESWLKSNGSK